MRNAVVIKGNKSGMSVYMDPELPFQELLQAVAKKFRETARFWGAAQMTLTLEGRSLTADEEFQIINTITENSSIEILCLIDSDANRIERCEKALNEKLMELSSNTGQFYKGTLRRGDVLEKDMPVYDREFSNCEEPYLAASVQEYEQLETVLKDGRIPVIYVDSKIACEKQTIELIRGKYDHQTIYVAMPYIFRQAS